MWIIQDADTGTEVGRIEELLTEAGDTVIRATVHGKSRDFDAPPFGKTVAFVKAQSWVETQPKAKG